MCVQPLGPGHCHYGRMVCALSRILRSDPGGVLDGVEHTDARGKRVLRPVGGKWFGRAT